MRTPLLAALLLALAAPARADAPQPEPARSKPAPKPKPPRAEGDAITLAPGESHRLRLPGGTQVVCDDPEVARVAVEDDALVIKALKAGATTCGARLAGTQKGLWKVTVVEAGR